MTERDDHDAIMSMLAEGYSTSKAARVLGLDEADIRAALKGSGHAQNTAVTCSEPTKAAPRALEFEARNVSTVKLTLIVRV